MKTLQVFLVAGMIALLGLLNVVTAEMRNDSTLQSLTFAVEPGEGSVGLPDISFDTIGGNTGENAQAVCAMTPGGGMPGTLMEEQLLQPPPPVQDSRPPDETFQPISSLATPPPYNNPSRRYPGDDVPPIPPPDPEIPPDDDPSIVPEPATLLIVGLGIGAASYATRRKRTPRK